ncbi:MAG: hypothetical protein BWX90_00171 [bacterium ADurb.Bin132]|nr:MAG: hypothetical protein BWX90_00171 [bacterium ADurb.Bin132]
MQNSEKPKNIDEYISSFPDETRLLLEKMREVIKSAAPEAKEVISYQMPAFKLDSVLVYFAAHKNHIGFYPTSSPIVVFKKELLPYKQSKGAIQFPFDRPIPFDIVKKIVEFRVEEDRQEAKSKKQSEPKTQKRSTTASSASKTPSAFPVEKEYARCIETLTKAGIIGPLPKSGSTGVTGIDVKEYPVPALGQVLGFFSGNRELVEKKFSQGFDRLELVPMAAPVLFLADLMKAAILRHLAERKIFRTRRNPSDPPVPVRVNKEKHVWIWETLKEVLDTDGLVYFPEEYSVSHRGQTKLEVVANRRICAVPGWSIGLSESLPIMPGQGEGKVMAGRKQLETGFSPNEYRSILQGRAYQGETGNTLEDFIVRFISRLEETGEVSNDIIDENALWCLAQYVKIPYADCVPVGRWHRTLGRARLDMHRSNNKLCTKNCGGATVVRLVGIMI